MASSHANLICFSISLLWANPRSRSHFEVLLNSIQHYKSDQVQTSSKRWNRSKPSIGRTFTVPRRTSGSELAEGRNTPDRESMIGKCGNNSNWLWILIFRTHKCVLSDPKARARLETLASLSLIDAKYEKQEVKIRHNSRKSNFAIVAFQLSEAERALRAEKRRLKKKSNVPKVVDEETKRLEKERREQQVRYCKDR